MTKRIPLRRISMKQFKKSTLYVGDVYSKNIFKGLNGTITSNFPITDKTIYNAPIDSLMLLGYFIKATYLGYGREQYLYYTFFNPYKNKAIHIKIDDCINATQYFAFFSEYPVECIIARQVAITCLLACEKNIPFEVLDIIQKFKIGEENLKLQKLLKDCLEVTEQKIMQNEKPPIYQDKNFFEYIIHTTDMKVPQSTLNLY